MQPKRSARKPRYEFIKINAIDTSIIQSIYIKLEFMRVYIQRYNTFKVSSSTTTGPHGKSAHRRFWSAPHSPSSEINNNNYNNNNYNTKDKFLAVLWIRI